MPDQTSRFLPETVDYSKPAEREKIVSDHMLQIAADQKNGITFGTLNTAMTGPFAICNSDINSRSGEIKKDDPDRQARIGTALRTAIKQNPELGIIVLQEAPYHPVLAEAEERKDTSQDTRTSVCVKNLLDEQQINVKDQQNDKNKNRKEKDDYNRDIIGDRLWANSKIAKNLPEWRLLGKPGDKATVAILYDPKKFEEVASLSLESLGSDHPLQSRIKVVQLKKREDGAKPFIVYNVHLPHQDSHTETEAYIQQILALKHNQGKTVYIMGDFNARFPPLDSNYHHNGTCVVPSMLRCNGRRVYDCTDAFLVRSIHNSSLRRLQSRVIDFSTGKPITLPAITLGAAQREPDFGLFAPVSLSDDHEINCYGTTTPKKAKQLISLVQGIKKVDVTVEEHRSKIAPVFLEKNIYNVARIAIVCEASSDQLYILLKGLGVEIVERDLSNIEDRNNLNLPTRFVLYPHQAKDYALLQQLNSPQAVDLGANKYVSALNLKRTAKWCAGLASAIAIAALITMGMGLGLPGLMTLAPGIILSVGAGIVFIVAGIIFSLGQYRANHLFQTDKNLAATFAGIGLAIASSASITLFLAPSVVFLGIPFAPMMLGFFIATMFFAAAGVVIAMDKPIIGEDRLPLSLPQTPVVVSESDVTDEKQPLLTEHRISTPPNPGIVSSAHFGSKQSSMLSPSTDLTNLSTTLIGGETTPNISARNCSE